MFAGCWCGTRKGGGSVGEQVTLGRVAAAEMGHESFVAAENQNPPLFVWSIQVGVIWTSIIAVWRWSGRQA